MNDARKEELNQKAREIRYLTMDALGKLGVGHVGGSLSIIDALVVLYYAQMNIDPQNPDMEGRDRLVLSKGHAGPALYAVLADKGFFDKQWLDTLNQGGTRLPSHADMNLTPGIDMTAGSLGQGFSCAVGIAIGSRLMRDDAHIYAIIGDGESDEGIIWEAAMYAAHKKLNNLIAFTDYNKMQLDDEIAALNGLEPLGDKWRAFGWNVMEVDGHDVAALDETITEAKKSESKPTMIILHTLKGKGVSSMEKIWKANHNVPISPEQHQEILAELKGV